jgi:hypothetical protein
MGDCTLRGHAVGVADRHVVEARTPGQGTKTVGSAILVDQRLLRGADDDGWRSRRGWRRRCWTRRCSWGGRGGRRIRCRGRGFRRRCGLGSRSRFPPRWIVDTDFLERCGSRLCGGEGMRRIRVRAGDRRRADGESHHHHSSCKPRKNSHDRPQSLTAALRDSCRDWVKPCKRDRWAMEGPCLSRLRPISEGVFSVARSP